MRVGERPGQVMKCPFRIAVKKVLGAGENAHACKYCAKSFFVVHFLMMTLQDWWDGRGFGTSSVDNKRGGDWGNGISQRPSFGLRMSLIIKFSFLNTCIVLLVRWTIQPSSQSCPNDNSEEFFNPGRTCA